MEQNLDQQFIQKMQEKHNFIINEMLDLERIETENRETRIRETNGKPYNKSRMLIDIAFAEDGTVRSYMKDEKYPTRFYTPSEILNVIASYKRLLALLATTFWGVVFLIFMRKTLKKWLFRHLELFIVRPKEIHYSEPVKELRRVLDIDPIWKDVITLIFQHDMAYCYRMQDILGELDKQAFFKNPTKEAKRLANMLIEREIQGMNGMGKFRKIMPLFLLIFRFMPKKKIKEFIKNIDLEHIKLSKEDIYWTNIVDNYNYRGLSYDQRLKEYLEMKNDII